MNTCKNCYHWGRDYDSVCDRENTFDDKDPVHFTIKCGASDDTNLWARLHTGPDFGCVHFKAK